jgi:hypothetical protein
MASAPIALLLDSSPNASPSSNALWCWRENPDQMDRHPVPMIVGNPAECLIRFEQHESEELEEAFQSGLTTFTFDGVKIDFTHMKFIGSGNEWEMIRMLEAATMAVAQSSSIFDATDVIAAHAVLVEDVTNDDHFSNRQRGDDPMTWCWKETPSQMSGHDCTAIVGDPNDCWIKYDDEATAKLERLFQLENGMGSCSPTSGYVVDFATMKQRKTLTGFEREVQRLVAAHDATKPSTDFSIGQGAGNGATWCWKETPNQMSKHLMTAIYGDPTDCWIKYDDAANPFLESSFQDGRGHCSPSSGYEVDFRTMKQRKVSTGFEREVQRFVVANTTSTTESSAVWCWEETPQHMSNHPSYQIVGDPQDCLVRYNQASNDALERTYQSQNGRGNCTPMPGYMVDLERMIQTKIATGFERNVQRLEESEADLTMYNDKQLTVQACFHCSSEIRFPKTMRTAFVYCSSCRRTCARCKQHQRDYHDWSTCPFCGFYSQLKDFKKEVRFMTGGENSQVYKVEEWTVYGCCRGCAKKKLVTSIFGLSGLSYSFLGTYPDQAYHICHANKSIMKMSHKKKIGKGGEKLIREAEETYERYLKVRRYSPDMNYSLYRARALRNYFLGAESAIKAVLAECGNFQPAIGALEKLIDQRTKGENDDDDDVVRLLDAEYQLLLTNCLGKMLPLEKLKHLGIGKKVIWERGGVDCVIS